jgi:hypothetical protein
VEIAEVAELFKLIKKHYAGFDGSVQNVKEFHPLLADFPYETAVQNVQKHIMTNDFPPRVSQIRGNVGEQETRQSELELTRAYLDEREESRKQATLPPPGWRDAIIARLRN